MAERPVSSNSARKVLVPLSFIGYRCTPSSASTAPRAIRYSSASPSSTYKMIFRIRFQLGRWGLSSPTWRPYADLVSVIGFAVSRLTV